MLTVKLKDKIRNTKNQNDRYSPIRNKYEMEMSWTHHPNERSSMGYSKHRVADKGCKISWKTKTWLERWYCVATGSGMDKDRKGQRKMEYSDGGRFPEVEGHSIEQNRIVCQLALQ